MYKALNYWVYGGFTGEKTAAQFIDFAVAQELDGVELTVGDLLPLDITEAECARIAAYAKEKKIGLRTLAAGLFWTHNLGNPDEAARREAVDVARRYLAIGKWLGVESVLVVPGWTRVAWEPQLPVFSYREVWEQSTKSLLELKGDAEALGVNIALENVWGRFLFSPMEWRCYLDQFDSERIGIYFDTGNCAVLVRPQDYVELLGNRIKAVHVKNFIETDCAGGLHGFGDDLAEGVVDFPALFAALDKIGYAGPFTAEMIPFSRLPDLVLPDEALAVATCRKLKSL